MASGKSVRLFLVEGTPGGMITAEIMNWTGHVIAASRSDLDAIVKRPELSRTGIYILIGENPDNSLEPMAYIGEGDQVRTRLYAHAKSENQNGKDFWNRAIVLTSKDANLTKAHARYLESRFIAVAAQAKRAKLANGTSPETIMLPEADISDMEYFISQAEIILPLLGVNILRSTRVASTPPTPGVIHPAAEAAAPVFEMRLKKLNIVAQAREIDGEFVVLAGSHAHTGWSGVDHGYGRLKNELEAKGTIEPAVDGKTSVFSEDQVFASPSAAAAVVAGNPMNGRLVWKLPGSEVAYGEWQDTKLEESAALIGISQSST